MARNSGKQEMKIGAEALHARLVSERESLAGSGLVHVDWLRFTVRRRAVEFLPPVVARAQSTSIWDEAERAGKFAAALRDLPREEASAHVQAYKLAEQVVAALGPTFGIHPDVKKGFDFYRCRWSIERAGVEAGWVGFLSSSDSPRQRAQAETLHVNLYGLACTFGSDGWRARMADVIDDTDGVMTRVDLALDFFDGLRGGMERVQDDYRAGLCDVGGRRPICNQLGDWTNVGARGRSFYLGSREAGKQTNAYEKGDQLYGPEHGSPWLRIEVRYGNKLRDLPTSVLRDADSFFSAASDWHAELLREAGRPSPSASLPCRGRRPIETVGAEVARVARWFKQTASACGAALFEHLEPERFLDYLTPRSRPSRLRGFTAAEVSAAFGSAAFA